jgi:drug/metabolite transporter (DMT)-like permease
MLSAIAGALIVGGVLALSLALWPDDAARNELQQVDFRLHELSQTVLGSVLVLGGLIVFAVAAVLSGKAK